MKQKLRVKYFSLCIVSAAFVLYLLALPFDDVRASASGLLSDPTTDIRTQLDPLQTPDAEPYQSGGRSLQQAPAFQEGGLPRAPLDQTTFYSVADATILQGYPSYNFGSTSDMWAGYDDYLDPDGEIVRSLVRFNISSLPANAEINEAILRVYLVGAWDYPDTDRTITTYRITNSWSEASVTWNNRPGYGESDGSAYIDSQDWGWHEFDVTDLVRAWYGGTSNYGIMLRGPEYSGYDSSWRSFSTREGDYTPQLLVDYTRPPMIDSITPDTGTNDGVVHITDLAGANFETGATVHLSRWGEGDINADNVDVVSDSQITCDFDLTGAESGAWDVVVTNLDSETGTLSDGFTVEAVPPQVASITPDNGTNDGVVHITDLAGANFQDGATVQLSRSGQSDINADNVDVVSDSQITCDFDLTGAVTGTWNVVVTNSDDQSGSLLDGFTIEEAPGEWFAVPTPTATDLNAVYMLSTTEGWAVGDDGVILHYDGSAWQLVSSPVGWKLESVFALSSSNVWAVGEAGTILHYNGSSWTVAASPTTSDLYAVYMLSGSDGWAVGYWGTILHYDGGSWTEMSSPTWWTLYSVHMVSASDGWAVGSFGTILHYDGSSWTEADSPTPWDLYSIHMLSTSDGWAVGSFGTILHYDGSSWTEVTSFTWRTLYGIHMPWASDGWAVGYLGTIINYDDVWVEVEDPSTSASLYGVYMVSTEEGWIVGQSGLILHYSSPPPASVAPILRQVVPKGGFNDQSIQLDVLGGNFEAGATIRLSKTGQPDIVGTDVSVEDSTEMQCELDLTGAVSGTWDVVVTNPDSQSGTLSNGFTVIDALSGEWFAASTPTLEDLESVYMLSTTDGWAVGRDGTILHYDSGSWVSVTSPTVWDLKSVWGISASDVWAVGEEGTILHYDGSAWSAVTSPTTSDLYAIHMLSSSDGWAVGSGGTILRYNGTLWTEVSSPTGRTLYSIYMLSASEGWAVGSYGTTLHYDGSSWTEVTSFTTDVLYSIRMLSGSDVWAVGEEGTILHYNGSAWSAVASPTMSDLYEIYILSGSDSWAVGEGGIILHYDSNIWVQIAEPSTSDNLDAVYMITANEGWIVGEDGLIFHYTAPPPASLAPTLRRATPNAGTNIESGCSSVIKGGNLQVGATVKLTRTGQPDIVGTAVSVDNSTEMECDFDLTGAEPGLWDVVVTNPDGQSSTLSEHFIIADPPPDNWETAASPISAEDLRGIHMLSADDGWAVGEGGTILHFDGNAWSTTSSPTSRQLYAVHCSGTDDCWAVGYLGTILHYEGSSWIEVSSPTSRTLYAIYMVSANDGWAVGSYGKILQYDGNSWTAVTSPTSMDLHSIHMLSASDGWGVGADGFILHYDGNAWSQIASPTSNSLQAVSMLSAGDGWIMGPGDKLLHYNGSIWTKQLGPLTDEDWLYTGQMAPTHYGWAMGRYGRILYCTRNGWVPVVSPTSEYLYAMHMLTTGEAWAVGRDGTILYYPKQPLPQVSSITPATGINDGPIHITDLAGANFQNGATVKLTKAGETDITATNTVVVNVSQITCDFDLTGAATGTWDVVVTNPDSQTGTLPGGFAVAAPPPQVDSITPDNGTNDGVVHITDLSGADFQNGASVKLTKVGEADIIATGTVVVNATQITCDFDLTGAVTGAWDVVVTNPDSQTGTLPGGFTVIALPPQVDSITPDNGTNDGVVHITDLAGADFQNGATVKLTKVGEADIAATNTVVVSASQITCDFDLTDAVTGTWNVVVTNPDSQTGMLPAGFFVGILPLPQVDSIMPASGPNDDDDFQITDLAGANFQNGATVKLAKAGEFDIIATNTAVLSATKITCDFNLIGAAPGAWDVVVTNPDHQSGTLPFGFNVFAPFSGTLQVIKQATPDPALAGAPLTYTIRVTNDGEEDLQATVTDTLPAHVTPMGILTWTPTITAPGGVWEQTVVVTVETGYTGTLTNVVRVSTQEGVSDIYTHTVDVELGVHEEPHIYLPFIFSGWPPVPHTPVLNAIANTDMDGNYVVDWENAELAETYTLEEATNADFTDGTTVYQGAETFYTFNDRPVGSYCYRVKATNDQWNSEWSNTESVVVPAPPMKLYLHVRDQSPKRFLNTTRQDGDDFNTLVRGPEEWLMMLEKDLVGTEYAYGIYVNIGTYQGAVPCDVEILLRRGSTDALLASWPQAFTVPPSNAVSLFTGTVTGIEPNAQAGDMLVLRIRPHNGYALVYTGDFFGNSVYSYIEVPGYAP